MDENYNRPNWQPPGPTDYQSPAAYSYPRITKEMLPPELRPLSAWEYFGYSVLFSIPLVGFICLIIFSFNDGNINRRSFARSYWCMWALAVVLSLLLGVIIAVTGIGADILDELYF